MQKLKVKDEVIVLAGKDKGKTGNILKIHKKKRKVLINGVNVVRKTVRPGQKHPNGGFVEIERHIDISNVAVLSPKERKATRVRIEQRDGKNVRVAVKCGTVLS